MRSVIALVVFVIASLASLPARADCGVLDPTSSLVSLPPKSGTLSNDALSTAEGSKYLYVMTQWGFTRAGLADPANPGSMQLLNIGNEPGSNNGGIIAFSGDCHQGGTMFDVAEAADGTARLLSDYNASKLCGIAFAPGQLAQAAGTGPIEYGQQVEPSTTSGGFMALGSKLAVIHAPSSGKFFGYLPNTQSPDSYVAIVDLTNPTGSTDKSNALRPLITLAWTNPKILETARLEVAGQEKLLLAGVTNAGNTIRIAELDPMTGAAIETASFDSAGHPRSLAFMTTQGRIFLISAEADHGLRAYEYVFGAGTKTITDVTGIEGKFTRVAVRGSQNPVIFAHNETLYPPTSFLEVYSSDFIVGGGPPVRARALPQLGGPDPIGVSFEAVVAESAASITAYIYRLQSPGTPTGEMQIRRDTLDLSCLAGSTVLPDAGPDAGVVLPDGGLKPGPDAAAAPDAAASSKDGGKSEPSSRTSGDEGGCGVSGRGSLQAGWMVWIWLALVGRTRRASQHTRRARAPLPEQTSAPSLPAARPAQTKKQKPAYAFEIAETKCFCFFV